MATTERPRAADIDDDRAAALDELVGRSRRAADEFRTLDQEAVDRIVWAMVVAGLEAACELAELAIEETGFGVFEDKVVKNYVATEFLYDYLKDKRTVGVIGGEPERAIEYIAEPIGVVLGVLPLTNPTSTVLFKAIVAAKTRNAILFRPSSRAERCAARAVEIVREAGERAGLPAGAVQVMPAPTRADTEYLFEHPEIDFIWTTGGQAIVDAANRSGKPGIGVGPGNAPAYLHRTCDIRMAVVDILISKTFDASVICPAEQTCVVDDEIYDDVVAEFTRMGARVLTDEETDRLADIVFDDDGRVNMMALGQTTAVLGSAGGFDVAEDAKVLLAPLPSALEELAAHPLLQEKLMPVLGLVRATSEEHALRVCGLVTERGGLGHTSSIYATDQAVVERYSLALRTGRILVNAPTAVGALGGVYNSLTPTFSLGCGTWGGSNTTDNVNYQHLLNVKTVSRRQSPPQWFRVPSETYFNAGAIETLRRLEAEQVLVVTSAGAARRGLPDEIRSHLPKSTVHVFSAVPAEPTEEQIRAGVEVLRSVEPDLIVAAGGGSVLDAAKVMRLLYESPELTMRELALPFLDARKRVAQYPRLSHRTRLVAVPTTSGTGSEVSPAAVVRAGERKLTLVDYSLVPDVAIVDPTLTATLPPDVTADSGIDALTHALEAYVSIFSSPYTDAFCLQAINLILGALPRAYADGSDIEARSAMANAATIAGLAFSNAFVGVTHALAHAVGARFGIPHGRANGIFLPHVLRYNAATPTKFMPAPSYSAYVAPEKYAQMAWVIGLGGASEEERRERLFRRIERTLRAVDAPRSLADAGVSEADFADALPDLVRRAFADPSLRTNPRMPLVRELRELLVAGWAGE